MNLTWFYIDEIDNEIEVDVSCDIIVEQPTYDRGGSGGNPGGTYIENLECNPEIPGRLTEKLENYILDKYWENEYE